ncbi:NAD(+) synthase [Vallitalea sp.]|jgi:NAD+ synthase|uniref:NAD(+) synthase n=1 Tax=Vallitalea sp. TaxID=1882829 RepID=UPI0025FB8F74|nr:NAD(+) synthase [Vallitalea sp.]MCT4688879.1 NAD(+) synthase [Vallitalea sp.]
MKKEIKRIQHFIQDYIRDDEKVAIAISGGLDSDVVARLCVKALGKDRVKLFMALQDNMEEHHIQNARELAMDLDMNLAEIDMRNLNTEIIRRLEEGDCEVGFNSNSLLDPSRAKCSLRTVLLSSYQEKGYFIAGTSNKTEIKLGFFLPFGDNIAHFKPIAHLYKSEVRQLAREIGTLKDVIIQPASAGFWKGQEDLEDIAYWIYYKGPIPGGTQFTNKDDQEVMKIKSHLTTELIDDVIRGIDDKKDFDIIVEELNIPTSIVEGIASIIKQANIVKNRQLLKTIS